jgi:hypothetical protein
MISSYSVLNLSCSRPVNWRKRISTMARDWMSDNLNLSINFSLASSVLFWSLIKAITSSMLSWGDNQTFRMLLFPIQVGSCVHYIVAVFRKIVYQVFQIQHLRTTFLQLQYYLHWKIAAAYSNARCFKTTLGVASRFRIYWYAYRFCLIHHGCLSFNFFVIVNQCGQSCLYWRWWSFGYNDLRPSFHFSVRICSALYLFERFARLHNHILYLR